MNARRISYSTWQPSIARDQSTPIYLALADALASDISSGKLQGGEKLPTHRALADFLGIDLTTVTRAYREAQRRGLIDATVGRGTFVCIQKGPTPEGLASTGAAIDRSMNLPPRPADADFAGRLEGAVAGLGRNVDLAALLTYRFSAGGPDDLAAGAAWLQTVFAGAAPDNLLVCPGAQSALMALLTSVVQPGDVVLAEALAYPGFRAAAAQAGVQVRGVAMDEEGLRPDALRSACIDHKPKALYCVPTIHNPTTATMSLERRQAIVAIARKHGLMIFEDDAYGFLPPTPLPPLASLAPELTFYVSTLAKCLTPGLRIAYLHAPDLLRTAQLGAALRATIMMTSPFMAALATRWIRDGAATAILGAIRRESAARQRIARDLLPKGSFSAHPYGHHVWLKVPAAWSRAELVAYAREMGVAAVASDVFATDPAAPGGVRLGLGAAPDRRALESALKLLAAALVQSPAGLSRVV